MSKSARNQKYKKKEGRGEDGGVTKDFHALRKSFDKICQEKESQEKLRQAHN